MQHWELHSVLHWESMYHSLYIGERQPRKSFMMQASYHCSERPWHSSTPRVSLASMRAFASMPYCHFTILTLCCFLVSVLSLSPLSLSISDRSCVESFLARSRCHRQFAQRLPTHALFPHIRHTGSVSVALHIHTRSNKRDGERAHCVTVLRAS